MLVITRKVDESITIGNDITVSVPVRVFFPCSLYNILDINKKIELIMKPIMLYPLVAKCPFVPPTTL